MYGLSSISKFEIVGDNRMKCKLYCKCGTSRYNCCDDFEAKKFCLARMTAKIIDIDNLGETKMKKEPKPSMKESMQAVTQLLRIYKRMGLEDNLDDAITEAGLLINILKSHSEYFDFKIGCQSLR